LLNIDNQHVIIISIWTTFCICLRPT